MKDEGGWLVDREQADRELTAILYLNEDWPVGPDDHAATLTPTPNPECTEASGLQARAGGAPVGGGASSGAKFVDPAVATVASSVGGELRCFLDAESTDGDGGSARTVLDVAPLGGRLVIFQSRHLLHAVLPCWRPRYALSCWLLQDPMSKLGFLDKK